MLKLTQSSPGLVRLPACLALALAVFAVPAFAQGKQRASSAAPILKDPGGIRLGSLVAGVSYSIGRTNGNHVETTVEGWLPAGSTQPTARDGFDLAVIAGAGAVIRAVPGGSVIARVQEGTLLSKVSARGSWIRVRRAGWVARNALQAEPPVLAKEDAPKPKPAAAVVPPTQPATPPISVPTPAPTSVPAAPRTDSVKTAGNQVSTGPIVGSLPDAHLSGTVSGAATLRSGAVLSATPDGRPAATLSQAGDVQVIERTRDWTRVRYEGWVRNADVAAEVTSGPRITAVMLRDQPQKYVGQTVTWRVQYLAVQEADALRPEIPKGMSYVLARGPLPESGFTYVIVTSQQAAEFRQLAPLDEVAIEAVIRAGRTKDLPTPVL